MTSQPFGIKRNGGYIDLMLRPNLVVSGQILEEAYARLKKAFPDTGVSIGTGHEGEFALGIRLHGGSAETAETLASMDLFPATPVPASDEPLAVRYMEDGQSFVDAAQTMTVANLMAERLRIDQACAEDPDTENCYGNIGLEDGQLRVAVCYQHRLASRSEELLKGLFPPAYSATSKITGGIDDGKVFIKLTTPLGFSLSDSGVLDLGFVLNEHEAVYKEWEYARSGDLWVYIQADPDDVEDLWSKASAIALTAGIHPVDRFHFSRSDRLVFSYNPPALTGR